MQSNDNPNPPARNEISIGDEVWIIEKENYGTDKFKLGVIQDILTSSPNHPHGIKVRLRDGSIGRVQWKA